MTGEPRLSLATLAQARATRPGYDVQGVPVGVVHIGPGAFFRAHQAPVYERLLQAGAPGWGVCGVSLRSPDVRNALVPQDGLYTLARLGGDEPPQVIGALRELVVAPEDPARALARLTAPETRVVALTVTEKGYRLTEKGDLDLKHPAVARDLAVDGGWGTIAGWITAGLRSRRAAGALPFLTLSCDNVSDNGGKLKRAVIAFARARGEDALAAWIEAEAVFPKSMVDSITPATDDALRASVRETVGVEDAWPIQRESFAQWVIEDAGHPALAVLASAGVTLTGDVASYERAKLRLLNGAHSTLAYLGLLAGFETVSEAMDDPRLARFVERLMRDHLAPTVRPPADLDLPAYIEAVLARFRNPAIRHRLAQIAMDGSQKLPIRLLAPAAEARAAGRPVAPFAWPLAAWMRTLVTQAARDEAICDPKSEALQHAAKARDGAVVASILKAVPLLPAVLSEDDAFMSELRCAFMALAGPDPLAELTTALCE